ncbi:MAG: hypothetical protein WAN75_03875 [Xanthobacteraceae bacterium]|jgi:hypothetical protein
MTLIWWGAAGASRFLIAGTPNGGASQAPAISIDEIHRQVNLKSLPELEISDLY